MEHVRIITAALTGNWGKKTDNPAIPMTPEEIASAAYDAYRQGAAMVHLHMRDDNMQPTMDVERFRLCMKLIREKCDVILNVTSSGDHTENRIGSDAVRCAPFLQLQPEMGSFDCGTMNWMNTTVFENHPRFLEKLAAIMKERGIKPEIEIFDPGMLSTAKYYMRRGLLHTPGHFQFVLGCPGGMEATVENLVFLRSQLPQGATWSATGIGKGHIPIMLAALALGGHVRVGLEDNLYLQKGVLASSNGELVARAAKIMEDIGLRPATPEEARRILGLGAYRP